VGKDLLKKMVALDEKEAIEVARKQLDDGGDPREVLDVSRDAMGAIGDKFEEGEYFLSELIMAGEIFKQIMEIALPRIKEGETEQVGKIVIGTVKDDIHNIGKDVFKAFAQASGFEVIDLGVDVPSDKFVEAAKEHKPDIVGMSCLITTGIPSMKNSIAAIRAAGLEDVKIIIGGGRVDEEVKEFSAADAAAADAAKGVRLCKQLIGVEG